MEGKKKKGISELCGIGKKNEWDGWDIGDEWNGGDGWDRWDKQDK